MLNRKCILYITDIFDIPTLALYIYMYVYIRIHAYIRIHVFLKIKLTRRELVNKQV